jgi:short-subunit dehydrogenase
MSRERPLSLITGASAGIGTAFARALAARGHDLILTARRAGRLDALAVELRTVHGCVVTVLPLDLAAPGAATRLTEAITGRGLTVDWLINNAGYGVPGTFDDNDWKIHSNFLRVMVEVPTELAWRLLPSMRTAGYGRIINVASLAGHVPAPAGHTLYAASKAYLIKFSQALALENSDRDVHVCALCPGFTWSEFHDVTGTRETMNQMPAFMWQSAEAVAAEGIKAVEAGKPVHVTGRVNRTIKTFAKLIPDRLGLWIMARQAHRFRVSRPPGE